MNTIKGQLDKSDYEIYDDFINFRIDDFWLDEKIDELYPGQMYKGLIPTLDFGLGEQEAEIVWNRILPGLGEVKLCPVLMCPDDCDFTCTLIVAEIENNGETVQWKRIGVDKTEKRYGTRFGEAIEWFDYFGTLNFEIKSYQDTIDSFKQQVTKDRVKYESQRHGAV